jgi:hypothetical protein
MSGLDRARARLLDAKPPIQKDNPAMPYGSLRETTLILLRNRPRHLTYADIAELLQTKGLTKHWIQRFVNGRCENVNVDFVQAIYEYFKGDLTVSD